ncbi:MAG: diaminopimelate epimerase [Cyclobacteriaceae bacterium]|nr:MAG: diaminopimelate epimerase [Cyclobacteriaceae bacterium]
MPEINFHKYQGTGNDFIMIDDRMNGFDLSRIDLISRWCDRKFGIGADGVILIRDHPDYDFEMVYFNPDGTQSLCGNGSRCAVRFAESLGIVSASCKFMAVDGLHEGQIQGEQIRIKMHNVDTLLKTEEDYFVDTGSPHYVTLVKELANVDVVKEGRTIRNNPRFLPGGTNVNFVQPKNGQVLVRTYERGVEDETLSCGTGVTAVALVMAAQGFESPVNISAAGGDLQVSFIKTPDKGYTEVYLSGPAEKVFEGIIQY